MPSAILDEVQDYAGEQFAPQRARVDRNNAPATDFPKLAPHVTRGLEEAFQMALGAGPDNRASWVNIAVDRFNRAAGLSGGSDALTILSQLDRQYSGHSELRGLVEKIQDVLCESEEGVRPVFPDQPTVKQALKCDTIS